MRRPLITSTTWPVAATTRAHPTARSHFAHTASDAASAGRKHVRQRYHLRPGALYHALVVFISDPFSFLRCFG